MAWNIIIPALISAGAAFSGVGYGARLSAKRETLNWTREQRVKTYAELLASIENCYAAFTLLAASLSLARYAPDVREDPKVISTIADWGKWDAEIDRCLPYAELIASKSIEPYVMYIRLGLRSRHRVLIMKLSYGQEIDPAEWKSVSSMTHGEILEIRRRFRADITHVDPVPSIFDLTKRRIRKMIRTSGSRRRKEVLAASGAREPTKTPTPD
jgi:hypothetical protein